MEVRLRFFASVRESLRRSEASCVLPAGATVKDLLDVLDRDFPGLAGARPALSIAVNHEYVADTHVLTHGDEVALIPPVSGGCNVRDRRSRD